MPGGSRAARNGLGVERPPRGSVGLLCCKAGTRLCLRLSSAWKPDLGGGFRVVAGGKENPPAFLQKGTSPPLKPPQEMKGLFPPPAFWLGGSSRGFQGRPEEGGHLTAPSNPPTHAPGLAPRSFCASAGATEGSLATPRSSSGPAWLCCPSSPLPGPVKIPAWRASGEQQGGPPPASSSLQAALPEETSR